MTITPYPDRRRQIGRELHNALKRLGAGPELLAVVGRYGDTLSDAEVLNYLQELNAGRPVVAKPTLR
jgi:hypothetical protein